MKFTYASIERTANAANATTERYDDSLVEEGARALFVDGLTESGMCLIIRREQITPRP